MERRKFEDSFKDAFQDAQVSPSESVWTNIELDLERAEGGKMKRRILFYKLLAAASVAFAMAVAGIGYYTLQNANNTSGQLAQLNNQAQTERTTEEKNTENTNEISRATTNKDIENLDANSSLIPGLQRASNESSIVNSISSGEVSTRGNNSMIKNTATFKSSANQENISTQLVAETVVSGTTHPGNFNTTYEPTSMAQVHESDVKRLPKVMRPGHALATGEESTIDPVALMMASLDQREKELQDEDEKKEQKSNERVWTSVGVAAGGYSNVKSNVSSSVSAFNSLAGQQVNASGVAYSMGVSVGTRLSNRWVLQGGVNYQTQSSDYTANAVVGTSDFQSFAPASLNSYAMFAEAKDFQGNRLLNTAPYSVNNSLRYVSVPMQAGYMVLNKKFGIQINAGLSTDMFLQNTITPVSGNLEKSTQGAGDSSPYRSVNFSGLVGTELTYKFGTHYRLALNPGLRYPMNSIYKSDTGVEATPLTFDVGLRFRYIFHQ